MRDWRFDVFQQSSVAEVEGMDPVGSRVLAGLILSFDHVPAKDSETALISQSVIVFYLHAHQGITQTRKK